MSRILLCSLSSDGFLVPLLAIARRLRAMGHQTAFVASRSDERVISGAGSVRIPRGPNDGPSYEMRTWSHPYAIAMQLKHLEYGAERFRPDVIVSHQLAVGPLLFRRRSAVPLALLGIAAYIWPASSHLNRGEVASESDARAVWNHDEMLRIVNRATASFGDELMTVSDYLCTPLVGDAFLLQSVPGLCRDADALPPQVRFVGSCAAPLPHAPPALEAWLDGARASGRPTVFVQGGRTFGNPNFWAPVLRVLARFDVNVVASAGRLDAEPVATPPAYFVADRVPQDAVLPHAALAISGGHTTPAVGAAAAGVPSLLFPGGSGTPEISERLVRARAALALDIAAASDDDIAAAVRRLLTDDVPRRAAKRLAVEFRNIDGIGAAASAVLELHPAAARRAAI